MSVSRFASAITAGLLCGLAAQACLPAAQFACERDEECVLDDRQGRCLGNTCFYGTPCSEGLVQCALTGGTGRFGTSASDGVWPSTVGTTGTDAGAAESATSGSQTTGSSPFGCIDDVLGKAIPATYYGSTLSAHDDFAAPCAQSGLEAPDEALLFEAPRAGLYELSSTGSKFDTVVYTLQYDCTGAVSTCDDDSGLGQSSEVRVCLAAGETTVVYVDGDGADAGNYQLRASLVQESCGG